MNKLIKEKLNSILNCRSSKKEASERIELSDNDRIIRSKSFKHDEYGYFNGMENL